MCYPKVVNAQRQSPFTQVRLKAQRFLRFGERLWLPRGIVSLSGVSQAPRPPGACQGELRIQINRLLIKLQRSLVILLRRSNRNLQLARAQIKQIRLRVLGRLGCDHALFRRRERGPQLACDFNRELALQRKCVAYGPLVALRPELVIVARVDQRHADDDAVP